MLETVVGTINHFLWSYLLMYMLVGVGIFFTIRLFFIQFRYFRHGFHVLKLSHSTEEGLSSLQVFFISMAARVGTGNIAGVAVAIVAGGPGAIFWMWLIACVGMATAMVESTLAQIYKVKDTDGQFRGGPAYYMEQGLGQKWMGTLFSILLIIAFGLAFVSVQSNTIAESLHTAFQWDKLSIGCVLVVLSGLVIMGGLRRIARVLSVMVPIMAILYLVMALVITFTNVNKLPEVLVLIVKSAFGLQEAAAGGLAYTVAQAMQQGVARGLFSNEAGMGSAANIAASAAPNPNHPASQGFVQMVGVFFDTIVICTASAAIILMTDAQNMAGELNGVSLLQYALSQEIGDWSGLFLVCVIFFFCFTTIAANYTYAETNLLFLVNNNTKFLAPFKVVVLSMVLFGSLAKLQLVWNFADISMGLMAFVNLCALLMLSGIAVKVIQDYIDQLQYKKEPNFDPNQFAKLNDTAQTWRD